MGSDLCYWLLTSNGNVIARTTVQHVTREDFLDEATRVQIAQFDQGVNDRLNDDNHQKTNSGAGTSFIDDDNDAILENLSAPSVSDYADMIQDAKPDRDNVSEEMFDKYIGAELIVGDGHGGRAIW